MAVIDDDPVTPQALAGLFQDAREVGRVVHTFALAAESGSIDALMLRTVEALGERSDVEFVTGAITLLMGGKPAGVLVIQPHGSPGLPKLGQAIIDAQGGPADSVVSVGMSTTAGHPDISLDDAIAVAMEGLEVARISGISRAVHSELYELTMAARQRSGTVYPLEGVQHLDSDFTVPAMEPEPRITTSFVPHPIVPPPPGTGALEEMDDPFAHGSGQGKEIGESSALNLTNGIAPRSEIIAKLEQESRAEAERLKLELEVARREKQNADSEGKEQEIAERRIKKLVSQLDDAENEIAKLRKEREEQGLPSRFKSVQGLDPAEPKAETKRSMIEGVFESNKDS